MNFTATKLKQARDAGYSDDEIWGFVAEQDDRFTQAKDSGYSLDEVSGFLSEQRPQQEPTPAQPEQPQLPVGTSFFEEVAAIPQAIRQAVDQPTQAMGETATVLGMPALGETLRGAVEAPEGYVPAAQRFMEPQEGEFQIGGFAPQFLPRAIVEQAGQIAGAIATRAAGMAVGGLAGSALGPKGTVAGSVAGAFLGPALFEMSQIVGPVARERAANQGREEPTTDDLAWAWGTAGASGALNAIGAKYLPNGDKLVGGLANRIATAVAGEGTTEGLQNVVQQTGQTFLTESGFKLEPKETIGEAIIGGGAAGGAVIAAAPFTPTPEAKASAAADTKIAAEQAASVAPETAQVVSEQANQIIAEAQAEETAETPEQRVARLQEEAAAAAGIELEEGGVGVEPTVPVTPPVAPTPEGAVAPVEPVVPEVVVEPPEGVGIVPPPPRQEFTDLINEGETSDNAYQRYQSQIDEIEDRLEAEGVDIVKLVDPTLAGARNLIGQEGYVEMPPDLVEAYARREAVGAGQLAQSVGELTEVLKNQNISEQDIKRVLDTYAIDVGKVDAFAQYKANEYTKAKVDAPPITQLERVAIALAAERGEMFDAVEDISKETLLDAGRSVKAIQDYFGVRPTEQQRNEFSRISGVEFAALPPAPEAAAVTPLAEVEPTPEGVTPTPETPNLEPLRRVARAEQTEDDVSGLVGQGLVELYNGQPVITQAGLETLPEAERPRLNPEARKIQIDTGSNEVVAEAIAKNLRIGVDQVGTGVRMPAGWTLVEDIYVPPAPQEVAKAEEPVAPEVAKPTRKPRRVKDTATMTAGEINKELDRLRAESSKITDEFIAAGRGEERPSEYLKKTDPLSVRAKENSNRMQALRNEIRMRYGADISQLPTGKGFGPRARPEPETPPPTTKESVKVAQEILNEQKKKPSEQVGIAAPTPLPMTTTPQAQILPSEQSDKADAVLAISKKNNFYTLWFVRQFIDGKPVPPRAKSFQYLTILSTDPDEAVRKANVYASDIAGGQSLSVAFSGKNLQNLEGAKTVAILPEFVEWDKLSAPLRGAAAGPIGQQTVGFGKYRDVKVDDLYSKDSNYVDWLMSTNPSNKRVRDIVNYLRTSSPELQLMADVRELEGARIRAYEDRESRRKGGEQVPVSTLVRREGQIVEEAVEQVAPKPKAPKLTERKAKDQMVDIVSPRANLPDRIATNLKPQMYPIQVDGANAVIDSMDRFSVALNGDGAGVGKTRQIIAVADHYAKQGKPVVIVTENAAIGKPWEGRKTPILGGSMAKDSEAMGVTLNLLTETDKPADSGSISITTYNRVTIQNIPTGAIVIFDESQNLANTFGAMPDERAGTELGQWQIKFRDIFGRAERTAFYSATPADKPHQLAYLYKVLGFNSPEEYLSNAVENGTVIKTRRFGSIEQKYYDVPSGKNRKSALYKWVNGIMTEAGNIGRFIKREISYEGTDVQFHDVKGTDLEKNPWAKPFLDALAQMSSFQAQGYLLLAPNSYVLYGAELTKIGDAVKIAKRELDAGRKIVIYFSRINDLKIRGRMSTMGMDGRMELSDPVDLGIIPSPVVLLRDELKKEGIKFTELHGKSGTTSQKAQKEFAGPTNVLLASVESGGTGINLDDTTGKEPRTEIFMFSPYRGISTIQAMGRIWRASTIQNDNKPNRFVFATASDIDADASRSAVLAKKLQLMNASLGGTAVSRLPMSKTSYDPSQLVGIELPEEGVESAAMAERTGVLMPVDIKWSPTRKGGFYSKATADLLEWMERGGPDRTGINVSVFKSRDSGEWVALADKEYKPEDFVEKPETPPPTPPTIRESRRPKLQMPSRPAGMETEAVATKLESLGFGRGGIVSVVNEPDASFEGRTIIRDGKVVGIELNAAALKDDAAIERVLNHEIAESANADGALNNLVAGLTPKERKEINDAITRLGYAERARTAEETARAVELLAEGWRGRKWFDRAVARVEAWANRLGYKLTRRAAEYIAARNMAEVNESFRKMSTADALENLRGARRVNFNGLRAVLIPPSEMEFAYSIAAYHGTPHEIKGKFLTSKIGTGEGATAYGWGLYFAENIEVAKEYKERLSRGQYALIYKGVPVHELPSQQKNVILKLVAGIPKETIVGDLESSLRRQEESKPEDWAVPENRERVIADLKEEIEIAREIEKSNIKPRSAGNLYTVEIDVNPEELFDWDKTFPEQNEKVKTAIRNILGDDVVDFILKSTNKNRNGGWFYEMIGGSTDAKTEATSKKAASELLFNNGINGIKYLDQGSRDAGEGSSNFVIFDENLIKITARNGREIDIRESRREDAIPTFSDGSPEAATLSTMAASMAKVDTASEGKPNPENKPTYKISEIASVWMDQGGDTRQLQDLISENTNLTPANAKKVANAIAKQYGLQQQIAETGAVIAEPAPEVEGAPRKTSVQRFIEQARGIRKPIVKLEVSERAELKRQIQLKAREARETRKARKEAAKEVAAFITQYVKDNEIRGPIKSRQSMALAKQALKLDVNNEKAVDKFTMYVERVIENANYDADLRQAKALVKKANKLSKSKTIQANQSTILEAISNVNPSLIDNPFEFNIMVERYLLAFAPVTGERYSVFPDSELLQQLGVFESEAKINQDELNRAAAQRLLEAQAAYADQRGISLDEAQELLNKETNIEDDIKALELERRTSMENLLTDLSVGIQKELNGYDDSANTPTQKELISFLKKVNVENLLADEKKRYIKFSNNLLANGVTYGLEQFKSIALAQDAAIRGAKDERLSKKFSAWITPFTKKAGAQAYDTAREAARKFASITQSEADTIKNIFGRQATGVVKNLLGLTDLSLAQTAANKADEQIANEVDEFYKGHTKKYGNAGVSEETNAYAAIAAYLIQRSGDKTQEDSVAYRRRLLDENIAELNNGERVQQTREAELKQKIVNDLTGATNAEILNRLKEVNPAAYDQLIWWKDTMLPKWVDFLKAHDENFRNQANNYNTPDFLSIKYMFDDYVKLPTEYEAAGFDDPVSLRVKQAANSIKRKDHPSLPEREGVKANISIKFGKDQYNALTDQVNRAYTAPAWERVYAFTRTPEFEPIMGGRENAKFVKNMLAKIRTAQQGYGGTDIEERMMAGGVAMVRRLASQRALGGFTQMIRQTVPQLVLLAGTSTRWNLALQNMVRFHEGRELMDKFPIGQRANVQGGAKFATQYDELSRRIEASVTNRNWARFRELMKKMGELWMIPLRTSDTWVASVSWMTYYEDELNKRGIQITDWKEEARLVETDNIRKDAAGYAEQQVDQYQGSSDPTKLASLSRQSNSGWREFGRLIIMPLNSFALQEKSRLVSDVRDLFLRSGDRKDAAKGLAGTLGGMLTFHLIAIYLLGAFAMPLGKTMLAGLFGVDLDEPDEEEKEKQLQEKYQQIKTRMFSGVITGGLGQVVDETGVLAFNRLSYLMDSVIRPDTILNDKGEIVSFRQYEKEFAPLYRYSSFKGNNYSFGLADILSEQAERVMSESGKLLDEDEMSSYTQNEQAFATVATMVEAMYFAGLMDADVTRMIRAGRRQLEQQKKEEEAELARIRAGR